MQVRQWYLQGPDDINKAFIAVRQEGFGALHVAYVPVTWINRRQILDFAARQRLPAIYMHRTYALDGGLMAYGEDEREVPRRLAVYVDKILRGAKMVKERIRHLLVTEGRRLVGIITDRDVRLNLPSQATSLSMWEVNYLLARLTVGKIMTRSVIIIGPDQDARDAAQLMLEHKIGALPVLDGDHLVGILTETDVLRAFVRGEGPCGCP